MAHVGVAAPLKSADHNAAVYAGKKQDVIGCAVQIRSRLTGIDAFGDLVYHVPLGGRIDGNRFRRLLWPVKAKVKGTERVLLLGDLPVEPVHKLHARKDRRILQQIVQRRFHHAERLLGNGRVDRLFLIVGAKCRLIKADQSISFGVPSHGVQALNGGGRHHGNRGLAGDQAQLCRGRISLGKPLSVLPPPTADLFGLHHGVSVDPKGDPVTRLYLHAIQLCPDGLRNFGGFQRADAGLQQRLLLRRVAERFQKESALGGGFGPIRRCVGNHNGPFFHQNVAFVPALRKAPHVRAEQMLIIAQINADMVVVL